MNDGEQQHEPVSGTEVVDRVCPVLVMRSVPFSWTPPVRFIFNDASRR